MRNALRRVAQQRDHWAGIPLPLDGEKLVIEPTYPYAHGLMEIGKEDDKEPETGATVRNVFFSTARLADVVVFEKDGRVEWGLQTHLNHFSLDFRTLQCSDAWGIEQESNAVQTLGELVSHRQFRHYMLTGMFLERSKRSGTYYVFRRLKPTVALHAVDGDMRILCALCMHPIGYYDGSWAGAMCPTDDVVAHLMLMRGDEHMFWRRCNQHHALRKEAGL